jgi:predicted nuclease with RNAse H fold
LTQTLGIDLASEPSKTAACAISWGAGIAKVGVPRVGLTDDQLVELICDADLVGIDAPLGWPEPMVEAVYRYTKKGRWNGLRKQDFRLRATDQFVKKAVLTQSGKGRTPLSVSADKIAMLAFRAAGLREAVADRMGLYFDLAGGDGVYEVYPAAALIRWELSTKGYKAGRNRETLAAETKARGAVIDEIEKRAKWLDWDKGAREACVENDDALDACLASLITRAAELGLTAAPEAEILQRAQREGWIHVPHGGSLPRLSGVVRSARH